MRHMREPTEPSVGIQGSNVKTSIRRMRVTAVMAALVVVATLGAGPALAHKLTGEAKTVHLAASLSELNDSGAAGTATAVIRNQLIRRVEVHAHGLSPDAPHAQHIHYGDDARNDCPTLFQDDADDDGKLSTVEGLPAYGPIVVSLTTRGDTKPGSALAVSRFPASDDGSYDYSRNRIPFTRVSGTGYTGGGGTAKQIADSVRHGEGVVVIHGVDYNDNGVYDGPPSELDPSLPREATDPAACGILK